MNDKKAIIFALRKELYTRDFFEFFKAAVKELEPATDWDFNWHVSYLCGILQSELMRYKEGKERTNDYVINIPFRSAKSLIFSVVFNAYAWVHVPTLKIMSVSYAETLSVKQAYLTKVLLRSEWFRMYFPEVRLMPDDNQKGAFTNTAGGHRMSAGIGGQITGSGFDFLFLDDPNKPNESKKQLENANVAYSEVIYNRANDPNKAVRFIIQQRIAQNDVSGYVTSKDGHEYKTICIPAVLGANLEPPELVDNYDGKYFWKKRFGDKMLAQYLIELGTRGYNSQLLQKTSDSGGNIFKEQWFEVINFDAKIHTNIKWEMFCDTAYTKDSTNDPSAVLVCGVHENNLIIRYVWAGQLEFPELIKRITAIAQQYNVSRVFIEPKASGLSIIQQLHRYSKLNVVKLKSPTTDKEQRANAVSPTVEALRVKLIDGGWNSKFLGEVTTFPLSTNDDITDTLVYAIDKLLIRKKVNIR